MHFTSVFYVCFGLLYASFPTFAADPGSLRKETVYHLPQGSTNFLPLAKVSYNVSRPESSKIENFTPAKASKSQSAEDATTVGVILSSPLPKSLSAEDPNLRYRTTLTSSKTLHAPYKGRFAITVTRSGDLRSAAWSAVPKDATFDGQGDFDLKIIEEGPKPVYEAAGPIKGGKPNTQQTQGTGAGEEEEVPEKTFLQKYWWAILGAMMLVMVTGGEDK